MQSSAPGISRSPRLLGGASGCADSLKVFFVNKRPWKVSDNIENIVVVLICGRGEDRQNSNSYIIENQAFDNF